MFIARKRVSRRVEEEKSFLSRVEALREEVSARLSPEDTWGVLRKLILNEFTPDSPLGLLRLLGFVHLTSAAGIHLYALQRTTFHGAAWILGRSFVPRSTLPIFLARALSIVIWGWAWLLEGLRAGLLRPWIIVLLRSAARSLGFRWTPYSPLVLSLGVDLAVAGIRSLQGETSAWAPGRVHYALAVGGGLAAVEVVRSQPLGKQSVFKRIAREHLALSLGSWIPTALWDMGVEGFVAPWTPIVSLITIPALCGFAFPLILFATAFQAIGLTEILYPLVSFVALGVQAILEGVTRGVLLPGGLWGVRFEALWMGLGFASIWALTSWNKKNFVALACLAILCRLSPAPASTEITQLDVGQGDAAYIRSRQGEGLIDTGSARALRWESWISFFMEKRTFELDWIALTHLDEDHAGALPSLLSLLPVKCVVAGKSHVGVLSRSEIRNLARLESWGEGCFPFPGRETGRAKKRNGSMSSVAISWDEGVYLNLGDSDATDELHSLSWVKRLQWEKRTTRILKVSHHGSRFSSSPEFLRNLRPTQAWISVGMGNTYGHPTERTLRSLDLLGVPIRRTDLEGAITEGVDRRR